MDQMEMRQSLLRMYEDQVMDNLIRARDDLPFIQLDYSNVTAMVTDSGSANAGGSTTAVNTGFRRNAAAGAAPGAVSFAPNHVVTDLFNFNGSGSQTNQLTLTAQPYTASNAVYDAYVSFAKDERLLVKGKKGQDPPEDAHLSRVRGGIAYWVPKEAAADFLRLYLTTTVYRQAPASIPTSYQSTVKGMISPAESIAGTPGFKITLRLADKVPNDSGNLTLSLNGVERTFRVLPVSDVRAGTSTDRLVLIYDPTAVKNLSADDFVKEAAGRAVTIHLNNYAPGYKAPPVNDTEPIRSELERLRLNTSVK